MSALMSSNHAGRRAHAVPSPAPAAQQRRGSLPWARALHVRAALLAAPLLLGLGAAMVLLLQRYSSEASLEAAQRMNIGLARYVVEHQPAALLDADGRPDPVRMKALAMHVMAINPAVEVYLLDERAEVIAHALDLPKGQATPGPIGHTVDMAPMRRLLTVAAAGPETAAAARLPVLGTDPRDATRTNIFSVAPVVGTSGKMGYLYIVLNGHRAQGVAASLANSDALRAMAVGATLACVLALAVLALVWLRLTRPLRELAAQIGRVWPDGSPQDAAAPPAAEVVAPRLPAEAPARRLAGPSEAWPRNGPADEIDLLRQTMHAMRARIDDQFRRLEDADRQRRELISSVSHDLRTPLASIQGYVETVLLRADALDAGQRAAYLHTALRHADQLSRRIADLFELSKLDSGRLALKPEVFCLAELLQDVVQNYRLAAQRRDVTVALSAGSHSQARVRADIALIERVLQNLVDNALRHTPAGGRVELALEDCGRYMQISVSDTGRGIDAKHLPHIFERYWRAHDAQTPDLGSVRPPDGTPATTRSGLGLAIVKRILDLHGSVVRVRSELERGTRIEFQLPHAQAHAHAHAHAR